MTRFQYRITQPRFRSRDPPWLSSLRMSTGWRWCQLCGQHTAVRSVFAFGVCFSTSYFCVRVWRLFLYFVLLCLRLACVFVLHTSVFAFDVCFLLHTSVFAFDVCFCTSYFCVCVWRVFLYFILLCLRLACVFMLYTFMFKFGVCFYTSYFCVYVWRASLCCILLCLRLMCVFILRTSVVEFEGVFFTFEGVFIFYNSYFWACVWCVFSYFILLCLRLMCVFILNAYKEKPNECFNCNIYWICSVTAEPEDNCWHANKEESCTVLHWTPLHRTATNVFVRR